MINFFEKVFFKILSIFLKPDSDVYTQIFRAKGIIKNMRLKNSTVVAKECVKYATPNKVNLNAWVNETDSLHNLGDWLSVIIVEQLLKDRGIKPDKTVSQTKHLYAVGSVLLGWRDATVWGSGMLCDRSPKLMIRFFDIFHRFWHKTDVRAVRGPETRRLLRKFGIKCPKIYGDPGLLMPRIYVPTAQAKKEFLVIPHYEDYDSFKNRYPTVSIMTDDWRKTIEEICSAKFIISSSLHGIILAEAYGIPAILLKRNSSVDMLKYNDYYYSTGRYNYPAAQTVEDALKITPALPDGKLLTQMQDKLLEVFPVDLWE